MSRHHPAVRFRNLSKKYQIGVPQEQYLTLCDAIVRSVKAPLKRLSRAPSDEWFWALKDRSFNGELRKVAGIIGRNGAGKATLLNIMSRITPPIEGTEELRERVGSLLKVGTGYP